MSVLKYLFTKHKRTQTFKNIPVVYIKHGTHALEKSQLTENIDRWSDYRSYTDDMSKIIKHQSSQTDAEPLSDRHEEAYDYYVANSSAINKPLHTGKKLSKTAQKHVAPLDELTTKYTLPKSTVYSGVDFHPKDMSDQQGRFKSNSFVSTSTDRSVAQQFADNHAFTKKSQDKHILAINVPEGHSGFQHDVRNMEHGESEVLLPRGSIFQYTGNTTSFKGPEGTHHVHEVNLIHPREYT